MRRVGKYILVVLILLLGTLLFGRPVVAEDSVLYPSLTPTPTTVDYTMPYPGLLPDHPLYFLKTLRDRLLAFLISNPVKKADFDLLQADKRIEASYFLITQEKKVNLSEETFSKGENYFDDAIRQVHTAQQEGNDMRDFVHKLTLANKKHEEVLMNIEKLLSPQQQSQFANDEKRLKNFEKTVNSLEK